MSWLAFFLGSSLGGGHRPQRRGDQDGQDICKRGRDWSVARHAPGSHRGRWSERTAVKDFARAVLDHRTKAHAQLRALGRQFLNYIAQTDYFHFFGLELSNGALQTNPEVQAFAKKQQSIIRDDMERAQKILRQDR